MFGTEFFFLRPLWLLLLVPAAGLVWLALRQRTGGDSSPWRGLVDAHLLKVLSVGGKKAAPNRLLASLLGVGLLAAILAMAGPTWEKIALPSYKTKDPTVIALSLAQSMNATDVKPTRLTRAGHKVRDILERMKGGDVGLVIYSDRPFTATPLTEDGEVIRQMLPELSTSLMPVLGNRADRAIAQATELLENAGAAAGRIVLIADTPGSDLDAARVAARAAHAAGYTVDVLGVGNAADTPLRGPDGRPLNGADGQAMQAGFDPAALEAIAEAGAGIYVPLSAGPADVTRLIPAESPAAPQSGLMAEDLQADGWHDMGYWLLLVPILLAPFAFRRNVLMGVALALLFAPALLPGKASAADLADLWQTPDQQGAAAFDTAEYGTAAQAFEHPEWRASALYRAGDYAAAAAALAPLETPDAAYNRGNALAKSGQLEEALKAYDASLAQRPDDADTKFNRDLVAKLLEEQKQQQQEQQQAGQNQDQQSGEGSDQQQADQNQDQQSGEGDQQQAGQNQDQQSGEGDQQQAGQNQDQQSGEGDQQQAGQSQDQQSGEGDQKQAGQNQDQQSGEGDQQQAGQNQDQQSGEGDQQQAGESPDQPSGERDQQQAGQSPGQQSGEGDQQQAGQEQPSGEGTDPQQAQQAGEEDGPDAAEAASAGDAQEKNAFQKAMDALLKGNAEPAESEEEPQAVASSQGMSEQEQANEQLLRRVPDDASGLLRARIMQNYRQTR